MVEFRAVSKVYVRRAGGPVVRALADASFRVARGELVVLAGPAGSGKSTVLRLITGEERASQGRLLVDGEDVGELGPRGVARLRRRLGVVPQEPALLGDRTVFGNLVLVLRALGTPRREARGRTLQALRDAGLAVRLTALPGELTAAERRRLVLARALAAGPRLLLVDEPAAGLDATATSHIVALLRGARAGGTTVLVATQAADLAHDLGARTLALEDGRLRDASPADGAA